MTNGNGEGGAAGTIIGVLGGLAVAGLLYAIFGPKCPVCHAVVFPNQANCGRCGAALH